MSHSSKCSGGRDVLLDLFSSRVPVTCDAKTRSYQYSSTREFPTQMTCEGLFSLPTRCHHSGLMVYFLISIVFPKFSSVRFSPHFLRTENRTDRIFSELNRTGTELFRTGSNSRTAINVEKCALQKFYTLKLA